MAKKQEEQSFVDPWELQPGETPKQFEAFCIYRDMGANRSARAVGQQLGKSRQLIGRWSSDNDWVNRCAAWDEEQDRIARRAQIDEIKKMRKRHADLAYAMLIKSAKALKEIPDDEIKPSDISRMVDVASKLERVSRGDVETVIEERQGESVAPTVQFYIPSNSRDEDDDFEDL